jgi:hypothetical protein
MSTASLFFCSAEWHFAQLSGPGARYAPLIHSHALHIARTSGIYSASVPNLAAYFGADEKSIRKALHILLALGFFEIVEEAPGSSVRYRPIRHKDWQPKNPGRCTAKQAGVWQGDTLSAELYAISGQRFRTYPNLIKAMRKTKLSDDQIKEHFRMFATQEHSAGHIKWGGFAGRFLKHLKAQLKTASTPPN